MSSIAIVGKPGASKSYLATMQIVDALCNGDRAIVTNVPLRLDNIVRHLIGIGRPDVDVYGRVELLQYEQVHEFWRYRGPGIDPLPSISAEQAKKGERPSMEAFGSRGVIYVLDELHEHLNSRQWASTGEVVLWYIAKHRHFGDDVFWLSQSPANVDKQWRSVTQEYWECRNFAKESFRGFSKGRYCEVRKFLELPTSTSTVQGSDTYKIDPRGIGSCYYTSLAKGAADTGSKPKGFSIYWLYGGIALACALVALVFIFVPKYFSNRVIAGGSKAVADVTKASQVHGMSADHSAVRNKLEQLQQPATSKSEPEKPVHIVGVPLQWSTASDVLAALQPAGQSQAGTSSKGFSAFPNASNDSIIVSGDNLQQVVAFAEAVRKFDQRAPLITVNAVVGRLVHGKSSHIGLNDLLLSAAASSSASSLSPLLDSVAYDLSTGVATFGTALAARQVLEIVTDFQGRDYSFQVVNRPTISVLSGQIGTFGTGQEIPIPQTVSDVAGTRTSVQYKSAEFGFTVVPTLLPTGQVRVVIDQKNSDVLSNAQIGGSTVPTLSTQSLKTIIDLKPSQIAYLGGIHVRSRNKEKRGVPVLKDIPVVNLLFGTRETAQQDSELVVLVSVEINQKAPVRVLRAIPAHEDPETSSWTDDTSTLSPMGTAERNEDSVKQQPETQIKENK